MNAKITKDLERIRAGINKVDDRFVDALAKRRELVLELARIKNTLDIPIHDRKREEALFDRVKKSGKKQGLDEEFVEILFRLIVINSKQAQREEALCRSAS